jgi:hypothetical protein
MGGTCCCCRDSEQQATQKWQGRCLVFLGGLGFGAGGVMELSFRIFFICQNLALFASQHCVTGVRRHVASMAGGVWGCSLPCVGGSHRRCAATLLGCASIYML